MLQLGLVQVPNMASRLFLVAAVVLFCIALVSSVDVKTENQDTHEVKGANNRRILTSVDCAGLCRARCSAHSRPNVCTRACGTCCARCNCVPPGTSGNREKCGRCYTDMTTHGNKTKCP